MSAILWQAGPLFLLPEGHDKVPEVVGLDFSDVLDAAHEAVKVARDAPGMLDGFFATALCPYIQGISL